jgi:hypothetical protein
MKRRKTSRLGLAGVALAALALALTVFPAGSPANVPSALDRLVAHALAGAPAQVRAPLATPPAALTKLHKRLSNAVHSRAVAVPNPQTEPPLHGTNPHGQGTPAAVILNPSSTRPFTNDPTGKDNGETLVAGRSRGEQRPDGTYHGHITIAALLGNEVLGVDTNPGETKSGPLSAVQQALLTPLCNGSGNQICLSAVTADSASTASGSTNKFSAAHATLGGANGIDAGVVESNGNISQTSSCQSSHGDSQVANVKAGGGAVASAAQSSSDSSACQGQAPTQKNTSSVIALGGTGVPIPAPGCADGTANTVTGIPTLLPIVCNADDSGSGTQATTPYGVREALDVFALATQTTALTEASTAASQSHAVAPPSSTPANPGTGNSGNICNTGGDNDCVTGSGPTGPSIPESGTTDKSRDCREGVEGTPACPGTTTGSGANRCNAGGDNDCVSGSGPFGPSIPEGGASDHSRDCAEGITSEGPQSCPANAATAIKARGTLPFTGMNLLDLGIAGVALLGAGLLLRRRFGAHA